MGQDVKYKGKTYNLLELSNKLNLPIPTIIGRVKINKSLDDPYKYRGNSTKRGKQ